MTTNGARGAAAIAMDRARHLLLAGARLALHEDRQLLGRDALERGEELEHLRRLPDELPERPRRAPSRRRRGVVDVDPQHRGADA